LRPVTQRVGSTRGSGRRGGRGDRSDSAAAARPGAVSRAADAARASGATVLVMVPDVAAHDLLELASADDQDAVETFAPQAAHPALGVRLRPWRPHRCANHADALASAIVSQATRRTTTMPALAASGRARRTASDWLSAAAGERPDAATHAAGGAVRESRAPSTAPSADEARTARADAGAPSTRVRQANE
jgi:hypothetical protein